MKRRFNKNFYQIIWDLSGHDKGQVHEVCRLINSKVYELSGLVSPEGVLKIMLENIKERYKK